MTDPANDDSIRFAPCPFCLAANRAMLCHTLPAPLSTKRWYVVCGECFSRGPIRHTPAEAFLAWNTREGLERQC